jgi:hypothetical protein
MKEFELEPDEHVIIEARNHWFFFAAELLPYAIIAVIPFTIPNLLTLVPQAEPYAAFLSLHATVAHALLGIWLLTIWMSAWSTFTRHFLNVWVLTNQRIVDIKQSGYFNREVSSLFLSRVQDVTTDVTGILPSILGIGDITVQSAGAVDEFHMYNIPRPEQMRDIILKYVSTKPDSTGV